MMTSTNFYIPLDVATRKCYHEWFREMIILNTLFVISDCFIQARVAALLCYNFYKIYPESSAIIICDDKERNLFCDQIKAVGYPQQFIHEIKDYKYFEKNYSDNNKGVFFVSAKTMINIFGKNMLGEIDIKLLIITNAEKADNNSGITKVVTAAITSGKHFRLLAISHGLINKIGKVQSIVSNLSIQKTIIINSSNSEIGEILYSNESTFFEYEYDTRELQCLESAISIRLQSLADANLVTVNNVKALFYCNIKNWKKSSAKTIKNCRRVSESKQMDYSELIGFTAILIEGYQILIKYGLRALFLFLSSRDNFMDKFNDDVYLEELKRILKSMEFEAFPGKRKRTELKCHPKFQALFDIINDQIQPKQKVLIFCSSPFGQRAIAEYLKSALFKCLENTSDFHKLLKNKPELQGPEPFTSIEVREMFLKNDVQVVVSTSYIDNFGMQQFDYAISMDYLTSGHRYMRFGRKSYCLLTQGFESIPSFMRTFDKRNSQNFPHTNYKFYMGQSKLCLENPLNEFPIEYMAEAEKVVVDLKVNATTKAKDNPAYKPLTLSKKQLDGLYQKLDGVPIELMEDGYYDGMDAINQIPYQEDDLPLKDLVEQQPQFASNFKKSLYLALYDDVDPSHLKYAEKLKNLEIEPDSHGFDTIVENRPISRFSTISSSKKSPDATTKAITNYFQPIHAPKLQEIRDKLLLQRKQERQRWLCVVRDAINAGDNNVEITQNILGEIDRLPTDTQFFDCWC